MFLMLNVTDVCTVFFLVFLEGLLSLDNALALAILVRHLPVKDQKRALTYGIWGAFAFRALSTYFLTFFMQNAWVKLVGGGYLLILAVKEGFFKDEAKEEKKATSNWFQFWKIVVLVELMDITFSADSILAAVSVSQNYFVVLTGGILGIIMMRYAARLFVILMERFPRLETTALLLVAVIGAKLIFQGLFHTPHTGFIFGSLMAGAVAYGFGRENKKIIA